MGRRSPTARTHRWTECCTWVARRPWFLALTLLCLSTLAFFGWRLGGVPDAFLYRPGAEVSDLTVTFWPNINYVQQSLRTHGGLPLWRTLIFSGSPFDADPQSGVWYLPNAVFLVLPATVGFNVLFLLHVVAAGMGQWTWSRATGTTIGGALFAALAYAFTPKVFAHLGFGHVGLVYAAAYVPWAMWAALRVGRGSWRHTCVLGLALGWQFIAHAQLAFYTGLVAGVYGLVVGCAAGRRGGRSKEGREAKRCFGAVCRISLAAIVALMVAAVQWLPMLRLAPISARAGMGFSESAVSSLPPRYLWGLLLADHRGFMDYVLYAGVPVLALAVAALRRRQARFWWGFVLLSLLYALGTNTPLYGWVFRLLPVLAWLRSPSRVWFVASAALALLAGWGSDWLMKGLNDRSRRTLNLMAVALGALALALMLGYAVVVGTPPGNLVALGVVAPAMAVLGVMMAARRMPRWGAVVALAALLLADLWTVDVTLVRGRPSETVFAESGLGLYLAQQVNGESFRVYSPSYSLPRHIASRYGLETADGVDPLYLEAYAAFMEVASGVERRGYGETVPAMHGEGPLATLNRDAVPDLALLGLLNVRYVAAEFPMTVDGLRNVGRFGSTHLYENLSVLPRAFVVGQVERVADFDAALEWVQAQHADDLGRVAAVEGGEPAPFLLPAAPAEGRPTPSEMRADIAWVRRSPDLLVLKVTLDHSGFLVLGQVWYPGWQARVDGQQATVLRADGVLSGLYLEPGGHTVDLAYRPWSTCVGGLVSGITWGALGMGGLGWMWWKKRTYAA